MAHSGGPFFDLSLRGTGRFLIYLQGGAKRFLVEYHNLYDKCREKVTEHRCSVPIVMSPETVVSEDINKNEFW